MKNIIIITALCLLVIISGSFILESNTATSTTSESTTSEQSETQNSINNASSSTNNSQTEDITITKTKLNSFDELKNQSDLIIEVTGTNKFEEMKTNYIAYELCTVNINEVIKGSYTSNDIKVLLDIDVDPLLKSEEKYLLFLRKVTTTTSEYYTPLGYGQGIYKILTDSSNSSSSNSTSNSNTSTSNNSTTTTTTTNSPTTNTTTNSNNASTNSQMFLESNSSINLLFEELKGNYSSIKLMCKN